MGRVRVQRVALVLGLTVFLSLTGSGFSWALWSSQATLGATVGAATVEFGADDITFLSTTYSRASLSKSGGLTLSNKGNVDSTYEVSAYGAPGSPPLAGAITVKTWTTTAASCPATVPGTGVVTGTFLNPPVLKGSLAVNQAVVVCARTSITSGALTTYAGQSVDAYLTVKLTSTRGSWLSDGQLPATQSVP